MILELSSEQEVNVLSGFYGNDHKTPRTRIISPDIIRWARDLGIDIIIHANAFKITGKTAADLENCHFSHVLKGFNDTNKGALVSKSIYAFTVEDFYYTCGYVFIEIETKYALLFKLTFM